ncbi:hypothetical protein O181_049858 [Austropuccinia psidii MF-1]|uniref:Uncharacterized protein n=1 Tax=Austropuccinia psidii MF-1 TaxID=1389203 RepID=A0A9Q3HLU8_9BASI|nr:hypothetical protein [Austropuccinia psidii MF-1]
MGQLTDEDYEYFDNYWSNQRFPISESDDESKTPILQVKSLKCKSSGPSYTKLSKAQELNTATLETQQQSLNDLYHPSAEPTTLHVPSSPEDNVLSNQVAENPKRPISTFRAL